MSSILLETDEIVYRTVLLIHIGIRLLIDIDFFEKNAKHLIFHGLVTRIANWIHPPRHLSEDMMPMDRLSAIGSIALF
jgi:hypothetical protein